MQSVNGHLYFLPQECFQNTILILCVQDRLFFSLIYSLLIAQERPRRRVPAPQAQLRPSVSIGMR